MAGDLAAARGRIKLHGRGLRAASQFQAGAKELTAADAEDRRIAFRVGINVGDVIVEPHDVFGDRVNIAVRLAGKMPVWNIHCSNSKAHPMNPENQRCRSNAMQRMRMLAGLLFLFSTLGSGGAMALNHQSASGPGQSSPARQETNAEADQRFLALFRASPLPLAQAIAIAERLHAGSRTAAVAFDTSGTPAYLVRTVKNREIWENLIDVNTGRAASPEMAWSLNELAAEERDNILALGLVGQELSDAVAIAEESTAGRAFSGGLVKEGDQVKFVVVVLSESHVKEVYLEPPCKAPPKGVRKN